MGLWKKLGKLASGKPSEEELEAERRAERKMQEYKRPFKELLENFEIDHLKDLCLKVHGSLPKNYYIDTKDGSEYFYNEDESITRNMYENFIIGKIKYAQIKLFALRHKIVPPSFFPDDSVATGTIGEFENMINAIKAEFQPEKITGEEHLESQLTIYLKTKFPNMKVERQQYTKKNERLDILVDDKYVFEIKVPKNRTHLRDLTSQLEEYKEQYPNLCAVIADISKVELDEKSDPVESNLSQSIKEYADKYKMKLQVPTIIKELSTRKWF